MISISEKIYQDLAQELINELKTTEFFNASIELDYPELYSTLHCSLILYHSEQKMQEQKTMQIQEIVPVWWEFETASRYGFETNDFSWIEFYPYLEALF